MIQELQDAINLADYKNNQKAKNILLEIAKSPENKQKDLLTLVKVLINPKEAGEILDKYQKEKELGDK
jgi:hypothetical protein